MVRKQSEFTQQECQRASAKSSGIWRAFWQMHTSDLCSALHISSVMVHLHCVIMYSSDTRPTVHQGYHKIRATMMAMSKTVGQVSFVVIL